MSRMYRTPGTRLEWYDLLGWINAAIRLDKRRLSLARMKALEAHGCCLPRAVIDAETDIALIDKALDLLKHGPRDLARPLRGQRKDHPTTRVIVDLANRRAQLLRLTDDIPCGENWQAVHGSDRP